MLGIEIPLLIYVPHIELHCVVGLLGLLCRRSRDAHSLRSHGHDGLHSLMPSHAGWTNGADEWAWSPLAVSGVSCGLVDEEVEVLSKPRMILGERFK
jgi:hypothetical protein